MNGETIVLIIGAAVAIFVAVRVLFRSDESRGLAQRLLRIAGRLGFVAGTIGWLMIWFTEDAIWSPAPRTCAAIASIHLKGQVYQNCSYLVHRYQAGEWLFDIGLAVFAASLLVHGLMQRQT